MITKDEIKTVTGKIFDGEPLSRADAERFIEFLDTRPIQLDLIDQATAAALQVKLKSVLQTRYLPPQKVG